MHTKRYQLKMRIPYQRQHIQTHIHTPAREKENKNNDAVPFVVHFRASPANIVSAEHFTKSQNQQVKKLNRKL